MSKRERESNEKQKRNEDVKEMIPKGEGSAKLRREAKKQRTTERKKNRPNFDLEEELNHYWGAGQLKSLSQKERTKRIETVLEKSKDKIASLCTKHNLSRIFQACVKYGSAKHRLSIYKEIEKDVIELSKTAHGSYLIIKLIRYGNTSIHDPLFHGLIGKYRSLSLNRQACKVVDLIYRSICNLKQKNILLHEFYGKEYALFLNFKDDEIPSFPEFFSKLSEEKQSNVLLSIRRYLESCVEKGTIFMCVAHQLANSYYRNCSKEKQIALYDLFSESIVHILQSNEGVELLIQMMDKSDAKHRKSLVKALKLHCAEMVCDPEGYLVILRALDVVDDTVLLKKQLLQPIMENMKPILTNTYGRKVFLHLLAPRSKLYFSNYELKYLCDPENVSKKDPEKRQSELLNGCWDQIVEFVRTESISFFLTSSELNGLLVEVVRRIDTKELEQWKEFDESFQELIEEWSNQSITQDNPLTQPTGQRTMKRILQIIFQSTSSIKWKFNEKLYNWLLWKENLNEVCQTRAVWLVIQLMEADKKYYKIVKKQRKVLPVVDQEVKNQSGLQTLWKLLKEE